METWKLVDWIKDIPPIYAISNYGNVKTIKHKRACGGKRLCEFKERIKKQQTDKDGYSRVMLYGTKPYKKFVPVHRLVATAFIPNPYNYSQINHKDENKKNNNITNLEWCTCKYNNNYGTRNDRISKAKTGIKRPYMVKNEKGQFIGAIKKEV